MESNVMRQLMFSVVELLRSQLNAEPSLDNEGLESVEVAIQCLETAYNITPDNKELAVSKSLYDIFVNGIGDQIVKSSVNSSNTAMKTEASPESKAEAESLKNEGNQLMRDEKFTEALEKYTKAISKDGDNAVYFCNRAAAHSKLNNYNDAIEDCQRALNIDSNYSKAYGRMGLAYSSLNNHKKAKECYESALSIDPDNESYRNNLSIAEEKVKSGESAPPIPPANPFASLGLGGLSGFGGLAGGSGTPDLSAFLNNPAVMNMATQMMSDPNMQNMMASMIGGLSGGVPNAGVPPPPSSVAPPVPPQDGAAGAPGLDAFLNAGRSFAEQMRNEHPELIERVRSQMDQQDKNGPGGGNPPPGTS